MTPTGRYDFCLLVRPQQSNVFARFLQNKLGSLVDCTSFFFATDRIGRNAPARSRLITGLQRGNSYGQMYSRSVKHIIGPTGMGDGSVMQDFKVIGQAMQHIGIESYGAVLTFFGIGEGLQYLAVIAAVYLFILDRTNWRINILTALLVPYIFLNLPGFLLGIIRGDIGYWIAFVAVVIKLFFPNNIPAHSELPASLVLLLVTAPGLVVSLRFTSGGELISLAIGFYLMYEHINSVGGVRASVSQRGSAITVGILLLFVAPVFGLIF